MQYVKFTKALAGIPEGTVRRFDDASAAVLIKRGDAKACDPPGPEVALDRHARGNLAVTQVVTADPPPVAEPAKIELVEPPKAAKSG